MLAITTSRRTSQRSRIFCKELASIFPFCKYVIRGKSGIRELNDYAILNGFTTVLVIGSSHGNPSQISGFVPGTDFTWMDSIRISIKTRKEMGLPTRVEFLKDEVDVGVSGNAKSDVIAALCNLFEAEKGDADVRIFTHDKGDFTIVDFFRSDCGKAPIGPQIKVIGIEDENRDQ